MTVPGGPYRPLFGVLGLLTGLGAALALLGRLDVVEVVGGSMAPTLLPGDRLLVESLTYRRRPPRSGEVVIARDPREPSRELIKRVAGVSGSLLDLRGDAPSTSTDSRSFGAIAVRDVRWRVAARYWPPTRIGRMDARPRRS